MNTCRIWLFSNLVKRVCELSFICNNIPAAPVYGVYLSQLKRYFRACGSYQDSMTYHWVCNQINTTGATSAAGTGYANVAPGSSPVFSGVRITRSSLVLSVMFCRSLFVPFLFDIALSVLLLFTDSDHPFCIFKLFLSHDVVSSTHRHERKSNINCKTLWLYNQIKIKIPNKDTAKGLITMRGAVGG